MNKQQLEDYLSVQKGDSLSNGGERLDQAMDLACKLFTREEKILDVGISGSKFKWEKRNMQVTGFDLRGADIEGDMHNMSDQYGKWDVVFSSHALEHAYNYHKVLEEFKKVAPKIFIVVPLENKADFEATPKHYSQVTAWGVLKHFPGWAVVYNYRHNPGKELILFAHSTKE